MAEYDGISKIQLIQDRRRIVAEHSCRVIGRRFTRSSGAAVIMSDHEMVFRELGNLKEIPDLAVAGGFAEEQKRPPLAVSFEIDFAVVNSYRRHQVFLCLIL